MKDGMEKKKRKEKEQGHILETQAGLKCGGRQERQDAVRKIESVGGLVHKKTGKRSSERAGSELRTI